MKVQEIDRRLWVIKGYLSEKKNLRNLLEVYYDFKRAGTVPTHYDLPHFIIEELRERKLIFNRPF